MANTCISTVKDGEAPSGEPKEMLWAEIGDRLGLSVPTMRAIRTRFGSILGVAASRRVPSELVPVIALIASMREQGVPDDDIEKEVLKAKNQEGWPEEVLNRISWRKEAVATVTPFLVRENRRDPPSYGKKAGSTGGISEKPLESLPDALGCGESMEGGNSGSRKLAGEKPQEYLAPASDAVQASTYNEEVGTRVLEMFLDLRREVSSHVVSEKAEIERLCHVIQKLYQEVRELRYALILSSTRKDRKRGYKGVSRLLSG